MFWPAIRLTCVHHKTKKKVWRLLLLSLCAAIGWYSLSSAYDVIVVVLDNGAEDNIPLYKDIFTQETWPEVEAYQSDPGTVPALVHYHWCHNKMFKFEDYLGLLSIIRIVKPQKIIFHYYYLPHVDTMWYHTWFQELKQSFPNLILRRSISNLKCGSRDILKYVLNKLSVEGGVYIGERVVLTHVPQLARTDELFHSFSMTNYSQDLTHGIIFSKRGFPENIVDDKINLISHSARRCLLLGEFNAMTSSQHSDSISPCLFLEHSVYPKDIWNNTSKFSEFARWLYYGKRARLFPVVSDDGLIPMVGHMVWMRTNNLIKTNEMELFHYLSIMSALYVAGFRAVYIHGEIEPYGHWWEQLIHENVTFVKIERPETIFQQGVDGPSHQSDIIRLNILLHHGGVYQDRDVIWVNKIPDSLRRYPVVACTDWPQNGQWPEVFNMGVLMAKRNAAWLKHFISTFRYYRDDKWAFNAVMMPYKAYEHLPDQLYVDRYLQVICFYGECHPTWQQDYIRDIWDKRPVPDFDWREARSFHFTVPKPPESLKSVEGIKNGRDIYAKIGRHVLEKCGRLDLLN
ncbi:hypothetical protein Btru_063011 [Bulinus truncatus]|nr:hypothetical protein Btru_063011 [Bulinus truncatus]